MKKKKNKARKRNFGIYVNVYPMNTMYSLYSTTIIIRVRGNEL